MSWPVVALADVAEIVGRGITPKYADSGDVVVVNQRCIRDGRLTFDSARKHDSSKRVVKSEKQLQVGDILVNSTGVGTLGRTAPVPALTQATTADSHVTIVRPAQDSDPRWMAYAVRFHESEIEAMAEGSTGQTELSRHRLAGLRLTAPPLVEQRAIAATLGALDDKIESNRRAVEVAEELAAARLSTGKRKVRVGDIATVAKGLSYKGAGLDDGETPGARPMLNLGSFTKSGALNWAGIKFYTGDFKPKHVLAPWDLVIANTDLTQVRDFVGRGVIVPPALEGALHTHHTSKVVFDLQPELAMPLWAQLQSPAFRARAKGYATGTTVASLPSEAILDFEITVPDDLGAALADAKCLVEASWQKHQEAQRLAALRDALLPELLSGRIRVPADEVA